VFFFSLSVVVSPFMLFWPVTLAHLLRWSQVLFLLFIAMPPSGSPFVLASFFFHGYVLVAPALAVLWCAPFVELSQVSGFGPVVVSLRELPIPYCILGVFLLCPPVGGGISRRLVQCRFVIAYCDAHLRPVFMLSQFIFYLVSICPTCVEGCP